MREENQRSSRGFEPSMSRAAALRVMRALFENADLETPALDARLLVGHALRLDALALAVSGEERVGAAAVDLARMAARRLACEPVARIIGEWEFYGLSFALAPSTLVPRPETETIVDIALAVFDREAPIRILDLGTGSGAILVALLHSLPCAFGVGLDVSSSAVDWARRNAVTNGVASRAVFLVGSWAHAIAGTFDLVVSNPPYIERAVIASLADEVRRHDPWQALDGGPDGLDAYRTIARELPRLLEPGGRAILEIGYDQAARVSRLLVEAGFPDPGLRRDLAGCPRVVVASRQPLAASTVLESRQFRID